MKNKKKSIFIGLLMMVFILSSGCQKSPLVPKTESTGGETEGKVFQQDQSELQTIPELIYMKSAEKRHTGIENRLKELYKISMDENYYYLYNYVDLNNDQNNEIIVYMTVYREDKIKESILWILEGKLEVLGEFKNIDVPIVVSKNMVNGLKKIYAYGGNGQYLSYFYNKKAYVASDVKESLEFEKIFGIGYISDGKIKKGFKIK